MRLVVAAAATAAFLAPAAQAGVVLGVHGNAARFASQTGQRSQIGLTFVSFAQGNALGRVAASIGPVPMIALNTGSYGAVQTATSRGIALGQNDRFLFQLNTVVARWPGNLTQAADVCSKNGGIRGIWRNLALRCQRP